MTKYSTQVIGWLAEMGYTHCFLVAGGNSMHLLDGARQTMTCVPFVHEVAAGIAAEYFNESGGNGRAFVLVTAGPGLTNLVTALAGAFLESRELLVLGGQVKSTDLATNGLRQRGIQEIDGVAIAAPVSKIAVRVEQPVDRATFEEWVGHAASGRPGPVFIEMCLDAQAHPVEISLATTPSESERQTTAGVLDEDLCKVREAIARSKRPLVLLGGGVHRKEMPDLLARLERSGIPVMTTWNAADRVDSSHPLYLGRPNTWGQRSSNILLAQADLIIAAGTRLGLQQTGFNWQEFGTRATVVQVDLDRAELEKHHPRVSIPLCGDAADVLRRTLPPKPAKEWPAWLSHGQRVRYRLPLSESSNSTHPGFINPYDLVLGLSELCDAEDIVIPCSSGGAFTVMMQAFQQRAGQCVITDKGLASMGYGLAGAIGAALAHPGRRTILVEGDGGFAQNLQELATVDAHRLPLKIFLFDNDGYASIRMTQRNYFGGAYLGCDTDTGLGFPNWGHLFDAFSIPSMRLRSTQWVDDDFRSLFESTEPAAFIVPIHREQTYFPKVASRVTPTGGMESNPIQLMDPPLAEDLWVELSI